jgi:histidyl-tRNA synthetase
MGTIDANPASGTRDFLPDEARHRDHVFATVRNVFASHGFAPLDTPAFERLDVLAGKYGEEGDQLIFKILRRGEHEAAGDADLALRYDLTVPLARVVARYGSQLPTPFRRYQIAPVWRADRPGKGRYREFYQCDIDTVGSDSLVADASTILALTDAITALGISGARVLLNARTALRGLVGVYGIDEALEATTLTALDKLHKIGVDGVGRELTERGVPAGAVAALVADLASSDATELLRAKIASHPDGANGLKEIATVLNIVTSASDVTIVHDPVLARGLSYYTGPVFEVVHDDLDVTIAAGGRYDGLIGMFQSQSIPATGGSLGIERLLLLATQAATQTTAVDVLVTVLDEDDAAPMALVADRLRRRGLTVELYSGGGSRKLAKQLKYADRIGAELVVLYGAQEREAGTVIVKEMKTGAQHTFAPDMLDQAVHTLFAALKQQSLP